jgi:hypothetical protein
LGNWWETSLPACYAFWVSQQLPFDEAIQALKRDPTHPVRVRVDEELTVWLRALPVASDEAPAPIAEKKDGGGRVPRDWPMGGRDGGRAGRALANIRRRSNRQVPDLK